MAESEDEEKPTRNEDTLNNLRLKPSQTEDEAAKQNRRPPFSSTNVTAVVKLFVKKVNACYTAPWRKESQSGSTGTGFLVHFQDQLIIVTNAHVVHRATTILARSQSGPPVKFRCEIFSLSLNFDLATLRLVEQDGRTWDTIRLATGTEGFGYLPHLDDNVTCVGFPCGGDQISVTRGVVSRIDVNSHGVLRIQIDAAINPGNSGGPVFDQSGCVVGIASSHLVKGSNIGYIIPAPVVHLFLNTPNHCEPGISSLGITGFQALESTTLRRCLGLLPSFLGGVRVSGIAPLGATASCLQLDDVLIAVDGVLIGQDGTVQLPGRVSERISFDAIITLQPPGSKVRLTVARRCDPATLNDIATSTSDISLASSLPSPNPLGVPARTTMWGGASPSACMAPSPLPLAKFRLPSSSSCDGSPSLPRYTISSASFTPRSAVSFTNTASVSNLNHASASASTPTTISTALASSTAAVSPTLTTATSAATNSTNATNKSLNVNTNTAKTPVHFHFGQKATADTPGSMTDSSVSDMSPVFRKKSLSLPDSASQEASAPLEPGADPLPSQLSLIASQETKAPITPARPAYWPVLRPLLLTSANPESVDPTLAIAFDVVVTLTPCQWICPRIDGYDAFPDYLIVGGCVFLPLTTPWCVAKKQLTILQQYSGALEIEGSQVIVMSKVLAHAVNVGYHNWSCLVLLSANGIVPKNLRHLAEIVSAPGQDILEFRLRNDSGEDVSSSTYLICLDAEECKRAEADILAAHMISSPCSFGLSGLAEFETSR